MVRALAWLMVAAITALTLVPPSWRVVSGLPHAAEHFFGFLLMGAALALAYPRRGHVLAVSAVAFAAILELLQTIAPGRHARFSDFLVDALAACAGIAAATAIERVRTIKRAPAAE
jgi:VanZ family protein